MKATSRPATETIQWLKTAIEENDLDSFSQCSKGCSYCCHQIVCLTIFEAMELAKGLEKMSDSEREPVLSQAITNVKANNTVTHDGERWMMSLPCPLLANERCSVYKHRPIGCRATTSTDQYYCQQQYEQPELKGHLPPSATVKDINPSTLTVGQFDVAFGKSRTRDFPNLPIIELASRIDLDRFVEYYCVPNAAIRKKRLKKLAAFDLDTLKKLNKRTEAPNL